MFFERSQWELLHKIISVICAAVDLCVSSSFFPPSLYSLILPKEQDVKSHNPLVVLFLNIVSLLCLLSPSVCMLSIYINRYCFFIVTTMPPHKSVSSHTHLINVANGEPDICTILIAHTCYIILVTSRRLTTPSTKYPPHYTASPTTPPPPPPRCLYFSPQAIDLHLTIHIRSPILPFVGI